MIKQYQEGKSLDKSLTINKVMISIGNLIFDTIDMLINSVKWAFGQKESSDDLMQRLVPVQELTSATKKKENAKILKTQIMIFSESKDLSREKENAKTLINTLRSYRAIMINFKLLLITLVWSISRMCRNSRRNLLPR